MDVLNVKCTCSVCGSECRVCIPAPVELENIYENAWKRFLMRGWHRIPRSDSYGRPVKGANEWVYYCKQCGGR